MITLKYLRTLADGQNLKISSKEDFVKKINWYSISRTSQELSEEFIEEYADKLDWKCIAYFQKLTPEIIKKFSNRILWKDLCKNSYLTTDIMLTLLKENNK
jgi:hypothetical protein